MYIITCICSTLSKKQCSTLESHHLLPKSRTPHPESRSPRPKLHRSIFPYISSSLYEKGTNGSANALPLCLSFSVTLFHWRFPVYSQCCVRVSSTGPRYPKNVVLQPRLL